MIQQPHKVIIGPHVQKFRPPHYASAVARKKTEAMFAAESRLKPVAITITGDDGRIVIYWSNGRIRQEKGPSVWAYAGKTLAVSSPKGFYRGRATRADVLDYLVPLTGGVDTLARELLMRTGPFKDYFTPNDVVHLAGSMKIGGANVDILSIRGGGVRASLYVRKADHLVVGADADSLDAQGHVLAHGHRSISYRFVSPASALFSLKPRKGVRVLKLPKSALKYPTTP